MPSSVDGLPPEPAARPNDDQARAQARYRARLEDLVVSRTVELAHASERAEAAGRAKGALLVHTDHEIRAPLNVITSLSHLMLRDAVDEGQRARLKAVEQAARHLGALVEDVLDLARGAGGPQPLRTRTVQPAVVLDEVATMLGPQALGRGLSIVAVAPTDAAGTGNENTADLRLRGDVVRLRQALLGAVHWALGCADPGLLRLQVHAGAPGGTSGAERRALRFEVTFPARSPRFDPDADADLASLQRLSSLLGGACGLQTALQGQWCCWFTVQFDVDPAASTNAADPGDAVADQLRRRHAGRRVLVVEDDEINQTVMLELLGEVGLNADTADDGLEALERVTRQRYALVAMDLRMPRLDGLGAARAMRGMPSMNDTPIVAVTANAFEEDRAACRAAGMDDFLPKPIDVQHLYKLLLHWLDRSPAEPLEPPPPAQQRTGPAAGVSPALAPLVGLEGVDAIGGLASVGGRIDTYRRLLGVFVDTHQGDGQALLQCLQQGNLDAAGRLVHRLRGSAATLGLVDVETTAAALEMAIDRDAPAGSPAKLHPLATAMDQALAATVPTVRAALLR